MKIVVFIVFITLLSACVHDHEDHDHRDHIGNEELETGQHHNEHDEHKKEAENIHFSKEKQNIAKVRFATPKLSKILEEISIPGIVKADPRHSYTVSSTLRGIFSYSVAGELIYEGKFIKKGGVLAVVYPAAQQEHWTQIEQNHNLAVVENKFAQKEYERINDLAQKGLVPEKELLITKNNVEASAQNLRAAKERLSQLQGGKGKSIHIKAPVSGILRKIFLKSGVLAESGETLFEVVMPDKLVIYGEILKGDIPSDVNISSISVKSAGKETPVMIGKDLKKRTYTFDYNTLSSKIVVPFEDSDFNIGEPVEIILKVGKGTPVLTVPVPSVIEIGTKPHLVILKEAEMFEIIPVVTGLNDGLDIEILDGLKATDKVVSKGAFEIYAAKKTESIDAHAGHNH